MIITIHEKPWSRKPWLAITTIKITGPVNALFGEQKEKTYSLVLFLFPFFHQKYLVYIKQNFKNY